MIFVKNLLRISAKHISHLSLYNNSQQRAQYGDHDSDLPNSDTFEGVNLSFELYQFRFETLVAVAVNGVFNVIEAL